VIAAAALVVAQLARGIELDEVHLALASDVEPGVTPASSRGSPSTPIPSRGLASPDRGYVLRERGKSPIRFVTSWNWPLRQRVHIARVVHVLAAKRVPTLRPRRTDSPDGQWGEGRSRSWRSEEVRMRSSGGRDVSAIVLLQSTVLAEGAAEALGMPDEERQACEPDRSGRSAEPLLISALPSVRNGNVGIPA